MQTIAEKLKTESFQSEVLGYIIDNLKRCGNWGRRGLFVDIAKKTGFTPAYVGQVLKGIKPVTYEFYNKISTCIDLETTHCGVKAGMICPVCSETIYSESHDYLCKSLREHIASEHGMIHAYVKVPQSVIDQYLSECENGKTAAIVSF